LYGQKLYRGFESPPLRQILAIPITYILPNRGWLHGGERV